MDPAELSDAQLDALMRELAARHGARLVLEQSRETFEWSAAFVACGEQVAPGISRRRALERGFCRTSTSRVNGGVEAVSCERASAL
jgi:hypothetical protein